MHFVLSPPQSTSARATAAVCVICALFVLATACQPTAAPRTAPDHAKPSILLISIDTLRADHLGCYGYFRDTSPTIDQLARESILFENAITTMATTLPAHLSMLTSTFPRRHGVVRNGLVFKPQPGLQSLPQMLQGKGYSTAAFVSAAVLARETGFSVGFDHFSAPAGKTRSATAVTDDLLAYLADTPARPFFIFLHYFDPHLPYEPPAPHDQAFAVDAELRRFTSERRAQARIQGQDTLQLINSYDGEIRYTNQEIDRLLHALKQKGLYHDTTIVLTADHGEGLGQHEWLGHGLIYNEELFVPMMIKPPRHLGVRPRRVGTLASLVDLLPTLHDLIGLGLTPAELDQLEGRSLARGGAGEHLVFAERVHRQRSSWRPGEQLAVLSADWKLLALAGGSSELFDMRSDRAELTDVSASHPEVVDALGRELGGWLSRHVDISGASGGETVPPHVLEQLRALGYMQ